MMEGRFVKTTEKCIALVVAVIMAATCFGVMTTDYSYAAKKVKSVTLTNVGSTYRIQKGKTKKLTYSIKAKKKYRGVKWKSSNTKVVTVSKKGKITAKKNGTAYITVYSKKKKKVKDKVKITVWTPVSSVKFGGSVYYVRPDKTVTISSSVSPSSASNRKLTWTSSNSSIATVSQSGVVTGRSTGVVTIKAIAKDGTNKYDTATVKVIDLKRGDAVFIAHRGYSAYAPENTLAAFENAAIENFDGAEMDVWESNRYTVNVPDPEDDQQMIQEERFDLMIMHDSTTGNMCSKNVNIRDVNVTNRQNYPITKGNNVNQYPGQMIPTLEEVLQTLQKVNEDPAYNTEYDTFPVIELKQSSYSQEAITEILDLITEYGGRATIISFNDSALRQAKQEIDARVNNGSLPDGAVETQYLVRSDSRSNADLCVSRGYTGLSVKYTEISTDIINYAHSRGLVVAAWTLPSMAEAARVIDMGVDRVTSNYRVFSGN